MSAEHPARAPSIAPVVSLTQQTSPAAAVKVLGATLRKLRLDNGRGLKDAAEAIRASMSKISRLERGESPPRPRDVFDLVRYYGVRDEESLSEIEELLKKALERAWWSHYSDVMPGWLTRLIGMEDSATKIDTYEVHVVPGLLQVPEYIRAVVRSGLPRAAPEEVERRIELRVQRQALLTDEHRPDLTALLDEGILRRPVGGPSVMAAQMRHLLAESARERINIRVVRFDRAAGVAPPSPMTYLRFASGGPSEMIYLEQANSATYLSRRADIDAYREILLRLWAVAENRASSERMLRDAERHFTAAAED
ncbi:helix-turn-helix domain-containing protein [Embleya hyalina]|uniref:Transcriptional regulator n=1 Tax=Embleya hyalina TaxID=516124 RepID=A0A401YVB1_9ACTN|nr:helix-turn-helix transcriptional regulator [Embleya hyalina]GCD98511.1 transcriptional regulator [Embleya hyalina]